MMHYMRLFVSEDCERMDSLRMERADGTAVSLERIWEGCGCLLLLGGPSIKKLPREVLCDRRTLTFGVNNISGSIPTTGWVFGDTTDKFSNAIYDNPSILKFASFPRRGKRKARYRIKENGEFRWAARTIREVPSMFFFERSCAFDPPTFFSGPCQWGTNREAHGKTGRPRLLFTPFMAIRLLHYLGVKKVVCCGLDFDMRVDNGYAFEQARDQNAVEANRNLYRTANIELAALKPYIEKAGMRVYNANRNSGCTVFDYCPWEKAVEIASNCVPPYPADLAGWYESKGTVTN